MIARSSLPLMLAILAGCSPPIEQANVAYDPTEAGGVAHALCLLGFTAVPLRELASGHHVAEVTLGGRPGTFVVDTGANATVLDAGQAGAFGLADRPARRGGAVGLGGTMEAAQVRIDSLAIGGVPIRQRQIMLTDLSQLARLLSPLASQPVHGIIGQDALGAHRAVIDVRSSVLYLIREDRDPAPVPAGRCGTEEPEPALNATGTP